VAKENDIDIVAGTVVELGSHHVPHRSEEGKDTSGHDDKLFNTSYYVDRTGKVIGRYTKKASSGHRGRRMHEDDIHFYHFYLTTESMAPREERPFTRS
jgi:predicted amidohydrolase